MAQTRKGFGLSAIRARVGDARFTVFRTLLVRYARHPLVLSDRDTGAFAARSRAAACMVHALLLVSK